MASVSSRIVRRPGSTSSSSPGPSRPRRIVSDAGNGTAPASEATATRRSRFTAKAAGRRPLRSMRAPTRRPSPNTIAAGPSHGASIPAVRRRSVATCGCGARRRASASGIAASSAGVRSQPVVVRSSSPSSSDSESEPSGERSGPAAVSSAAIGRFAEVAGATADLLAIAADRVDLAVVGDRAERLGESPDRMGVRGVALVEDRVAELDRRAQVRIELGQASAGDEALVDDRAARGRRHRQLGHGTTGGPGRRFQPAAGDDQAALEGVVGQGPGIRRCRGSGGRRWPAPRPGATRLPQHRALPDPSARAATPRSAAPASANTRVTSVRAARCGGAATRQEEHHDGRPIGRQRGVEERQERGVQGQGDARAVARLTVRAERAAVSEGRQPGEGQRQDPRPRPPARIRDEAHATSVVLEARVVQRGGGTSTWPWHRLSPGSGGVELQPIGTREEPVPIGLSTPAARSGTRPRRASRGRCPSPRPWPRRGSRGSRPRA